MLLRYNAFTAIQKHFIWISSTAIYTLRAISRKTFFAKLPPRGGSSTIAFSSELLPRYDDSFVALAA